MTAPLIDPAEPRFRLGLEEMDRTHLELIDLVNRLAAVDDAGFPALFDALLAHTEAHFAQEEQWMTASAFPALHEHRGEHRRVLADLRNLGQRAASGRPALARAYVREQLPHWFALHAATMDSALAGHLKAGARG
ncbi:hemerythrin domain-containing protein [uncultured Thiohalocapsa sp.]|uniref:bacteriohemerythrin n=1 Tax=uncultured Thiohalocapsa sp. TaxID=768990 RepID=UPI0025EEEF2E|nr:hemerythrin domain-containing protein [uncultured Thiohalocapsa sp.]